MEQNNKQTNHGSFTINMVPEKAKTPVSFMQHFWPLQLKTCGGDYAFVEEPNIQIPAIITIFRFAQRFQNKIIVRNYRSLCTHV